jgi:hypothetical protein
MIKVSYKVVVKKKICLGKSMVELDYADYTDYAG